MRLFITRVTFFLPLLLLTGCGDHRQVSSQATSPPYQPPAQTPLKVAPTSSAENDPLLSEGSGSDDPLLSNGQRNPDPLQRGDPLQGRAMPTDHSHWLRGSTRDANLTVLLNGVRQGVYSGLVDKDITMRLRKGMNSVTFVCEPRQADAFVQMNILESEHHPPIPPLVTFQSQPPASNTDLKPTTQTFIFFAK